MISLRRAGPSAALCAVLVAVIAARAMASVWSRPVVAACVTVFVAIVVQATPYVVLGVLVSAALARVPQRALRRLVSSPPAVAVPLAGIAGAALPGCECGSATIGLGLVRRGVAAAPAVTFMLSAPATNPVVLIATATAFPGQPRVVLARFTASLLLSVGVGFAFTGRAAALRVPPHVHGGVLADLVRAVGLLCSGAVAAALVTVALPGNLMHGVASSAIGGVTALAILAAISAVCSTADAFVASALTQFSRTAQLTFMVVGPAVDLRQSAMQAGTFGIRLAVRLAVLGLLGGVATAVLVGGVLL